MLLFSDVHVGEICESKWSYVLEVPDVEFIRPCGVVVFALFIAAWTCVVVSVMLVVCSLSVFLSMCLFVLCVMCYV